MGCGGGRGASSYGSGNPVGIWKGVIQTVSALYLRRSAKAIIMLQDAAVSITSTATVAAILVGNDGEVVAPKT